MSTGPDSAGHQDARESSEADAVAEVFNRFTLDSGRRRRRKRKDGSPPDEEINQQPSEPEASWPEDEPSPRTDNGQEEIKSTSIRPYAWTGGRTRSNQRLELETLVSTSELGQQSRLQRTEHHAIAELCTHPKSLAEVSAMLGVPLGVARVLVGDLADLGLITVHDTVSESDSTSHLLLMERVLSGLRRL